MAAEDAGIYHNGIDSERFGVSVGTTLGGLIFRVGTTWHSIGKGAARMNPFTASAAFPNATSSQISIHLKAKGPSYTISNACTSSFRRDRFCHIFDPERNDGYYGCRGADAPLYPTILARFVFPALCLNEPAVHLNLLILTETV